MVVVFVVVVIGVMVIECLGMFDWRIVFVFIVVVCSKGVGEGDGDGDSDGEFIFLVLVDVFGLIDDWMLWVIVLLFWLVYKVCWIVCR